MIFAFKAFMFHIAAYHDNCPKNQNSWCQYQQDMLNGTISYKDKGGLPLDVSEAILPVHNDSCKQENLSKYLHGRTQNRNKSFNGMTWNHVPKANHVGIDILSLGVYDAIAHFYDGAIASLEILKDMNMEPGDHMMKGLQIQNKSRKIHATYRMSEHNLKEEKLSDIAERKNRIKILIRRDQLTKQEDFENEWIYILLSIYFALYTHLFYKKIIFLPEP